MQTFIITIHLMVVAALVVVVLLQRSEGGALGAGGGGGFMTGRGQANALTRATGILAAMFFATSLALTILANYTRAPASVFDAAPGTAKPAAATPPAPGNGLDALKLYEQQKQGGAAPVAPAPAAPAPAAPAPVPAPDAPKP